MAVAVDAAERQPQRTRDLVVVLLHQGWVGVRMRRCPVADDDFYKGVLLGLLLIGSTHHYVAGRPAVALSRGAGFVVLDP